jgi:RHS repeat-associated protein
VPVPSCGGPGAEPPQSSWRRALAGRGRARYTTCGNRVDASWPGPPGPDTQGMDYVYDHEQWLVEAVAYQANHQGKRNDREVVRLLYDDPSAGSGQGLGRRLAKEYIPSPVSGEGQGGGRRTEYIYDGLDPVVEYRLWNGQRDEFYRGEGARLLTVRHFPEGTEGQSYWYAYDGRGNVAGLTKDEGQSTHDYRYGAYGQILPARGNASTMLSAGFTDPHNHYTFGGKEWEENLGLYEFGYRLYDPQAGVWLTGDPLRGSVGRPRTLHRYQYAFASPISYYDAYGLQGEGPPEKPTPTNDPGKTLLERLSEGPPPPSGAVESWCVAPDWIGSSDHPEVYAYRESITAHAYAHGVPPP